MGIGAYEVAAGYLRDVGIPGGPAQAGISYKVPGSSALRVESLSFEVFTTGGGAVRQAIVMVNNAVGVPRFAIAAPDTQASGLTVVYSFGPEIPAFGSSALQLMGGPFVRGFLPAGSEIQIVVVSAGGGDLIGNVGLFACAEPVTGGDDG